MVEAARDSMGRWVSCDGGAGRLGVRGYKGLRRVGKGCLAESQGRQQRYRHRSSEAGGSAEALGLR